MSEVSTDQNNIPSKSYQPTIEKKNYGISAEILDYIVTNCEYEDDNGVLWRYSKDKVSGGLKKELENELGVSGVNVTRRMYDLKKRGDIVVINAKVPTVSLDGECTTLSVSIVNTGVTPQGRQRLKNILESDHSNKFNGQNNLVSKIVDVAIKGYTLALQQGDEEKAKIIFQMADSAALYENSRQELLEKLAEIRQEIATIEKSVINF